MTLLRILKPEIWPRRLLHLQSGSQRQVLPQKATELGKILHKDILFSGPITIAEYMRQCLTHPKYGYYTTREQVFGATGDFVTGPQISPVFSEMLAVWIANYISKNDDGGGGLRSAGVGRDKVKKSAFRLVELGPGCGSLQKALLPALARFGCTPTSLLLVDASPVLREKQRIVLESLPKAVVPKVKWFASASQGLASLDQDFQDENNNQDDRETRVKTIFLAHEFFDALPVHIFKRVHPPASQARAASSQEPLPQWRELLVDAVPEDPQRAALRLVTAPTHTPASALIPLVNPKSDENIIEVSPETLSLTRRLAQVVRRDNGAALIIDYGHTSRRNTTTLRAITRHQQTHFLHTPGQADLTADVDFSAISSHLANQKIQFLGATTQRLFLLRLGIAQRMRVLAHSVIQNQNDPKTIDSKLLRLQQDYDRLVGTSENDMGQVYKVAAICPPGTGSLPGFED